MAQVRQDCQDCQDGSRERSHAINLNHAGV